MEQILKIKKTVDELDNVGYIREGDAAIDLRASGVFVIDLDHEKREIAANEYEIKPNERVLVKTGIKVAMPPGHYGHIKGRSGLAMQHGLGSLAGVIDENYRGEIGVVLVNHGNKPYKLTKNERVAQMIIQEYKRVKVEYVEDLDETNRSVNGFGSSGRH